MERPLRVNGCPDVTIYFRRPLHWHDGGRIGRSRGSEIQGSRPSVVMPVCTDRCPASSGRLKTRDSLAVFLRYGALLAREELVAAEPTRVRVKLDESISRSVSQVLVGAGHDVDTVVAENLRGASDPPS